MDRGTFAAREPPTAVGRPFLSLSGRGCDVKVGSRDVKCGRMAALPLRRGEVREVFFCVVASIILTVGIGEATMGEKVDPRRAQVAQVGGRVENSIFRS